MIPPAMYAAKFCYTSLQNPDLKCLIMGRPTLSRLIQTTMLQSQPAQAKSQACPLAQPHISEGLQNNQISFKIKPYISLKNTKNSYVISRLCVFQVHKKGQLQLKFTWKKGMSKPKNLKKTFLHIIQKLFLKYTT